MLINFLFDTFRHFQHFVTFKTFFGECFTQMFFFDTGCLVFFKFDIQTLNAIFLKKIPELSPIIFFFFFE